MNKLIIVRHGESVGNASNVIQGKNNDYGLTNDGKKAIRLKVKSSLEIFKNAKRILVSPYKRTIETSEIISDEANLPIIINENIEEMDAGILSGVNKDVAQSQFAQYYEIWKNREDLDKIPNAETGEKLQARALGFLMQYYGKTDFCDVIVTHAGFIRCLINTIENRARTQKFSIENGAIFQIENLFEKMSIERKDRAMNSDVFIVSTANGKYVVKLKRGKITKQDNAERNLLDSVYAENIPRVLNMQNYYDDTYCKIIKYVKGEHKYGVLTDEEYKALIESEKRLQIMLSSQKAKDFRVSNLRDIVKVIYSENPNAYVKELSQKILSSKYVSMIGNVDYYVLSHNDLNRDNILFERTEAGSVKANIIDFESLEYSPIDFQFASMLASGLLLEGESFEKIEKTIFDKGKDVEKILYLMQIRVLKGLHFFTSRNEYSSNNKQASMDLLKRYFCVSERIQMELDKINSRKDEGR